MNQQTTVLLVEDDEGLQNLITLRLKKLNLNLFSIGSGTEAVQWCLENEADMLILDFRLQDMDADELVRRLKEKDRMFPFLILTGYGDQKTAVEMMKLGAIDYILKDISLLDNLPAIVTKTIDLITTRKQNIEYQQQIIENEKKYRSIFENIHDVYFESTLEGDILEVSPSVSKTFGFDREKIINRNVFKDFAQIESPTKLVDKFKEYGRFEDFEIFVRDIDNNVKTCSLTCTIIEGKVVGTIRDITDRKRLERELLNAIIKTEEKERKRISEDLHDGLGALLSSVKIYVNLLNKPENNYRRNDLARYTTELIDEAITNARMMSNNLTPSVLNDFGLQEAVLSFCKKINQANIVNIHFKTNIKGRVDDTIDIVFYRIIQELLNNTIKHAKAANIYIQLTIRGKEIALEYKDDGIGFDTAILNQQNDTGKGMGLKNLFNKAMLLNASCNIQSKINRGVVVKVSMNPP